VVELIENPLPCIGCVNADDSFPRGCLVGRDKCPYKLKPSTKCTTTTHTISGAAFDLLKVKPVIFAQDIVNLGFSYSSVRNRLAKMVKESKLVRLQNGCFTLPNSPLVPYEKRTRASSSFLEVLGVAFANMPPEDFGLHDLFVVAGDFYAVSWVNSHADGWRRIHKGFIRRFSLANEKLGGFSDRYVEVTVSSNTVEFNVAADMNPFMPEDLWDLGLALRDLARSFGAKIDVADLIVKQVHLSKDSSGFNYDSSFDFTWNDFAGNLLHLYYKKKKGVARMEKLVVPNQGFQKFVDDQMNPHAGLERRIEALTQSSITNDQLLRSNATLTDKIGEAVLALVESNKITQQGLVQIATALVAKKAQRSPRVVKAARKPRFSFLNFFRRFGATQVKIPAIKEPKVQKTRVVEAMYGEKQRWVVLEQCEYCGVGDCDKKPRIGCNDFALSSKFKVEERFGAKYLIPSSFVWSDKLNQWVERKQ